MEGKEEKGSFLCEGTKGREGMEDEGGEGRRKVEDLAMARKFRGI